MASAEEQDAQFAAGDVERRVAELERKLSLLNEAGLDRLTQSGYLQIDGIPMRYDKNGIQAEAPFTSGQQPAFYFMESLAPNPALIYPRSQMEGYSGLSGPTTSIIRLKSSFNSTSYGYVHAFAGLAANNPNATLGAVDSTSSASAELEITSGEGKFELTNAYIRLASGTPSSPANGDFWYDSGANKLYARINGVTVELGGSSGMPMPPIVGTQSWNCLGVEMAAQTVAAPASATWPANNRIVGIPVKVTEDCTVTKLWVMNGATANANINMCLYDSSFAQIANSEMGSTAQAGTDVIQEFDITNVAITAGLYYIACVFSATTGTAYRVVAGGVAPIEVGQSWGIWQQDLANVDLPSTATPAVAAASFTPIMGMSVSPRTLVT